MSQDGEQEDAAVVYCNGPVQFIRIDQKGKCSVEENAATLLSHIQGGLAVVGIAGLYRTGKSFLLNRLLGLQNGFEIGPSVNPCTKGLWIWGQPVEIQPDFHCVFVDTEGLGSAQRTASADMQIFSLCILLSSYLIYNSMGALDEQAIDDLHLVSNLAKHIHVKSAESHKQDTVSELSEYFPAFMWALRDFHLEPMDNTGAPISERQYLENALQNVPGQDEKNTLREGIKDLFRQRNCMTLPRPCNDEADLRKVERMPYESLRPQFRTKVEAFVKCVYSSLKPKTLKGTQLTGAMLCDLAREYCKAMNNSGVPVIHSAWTSVIQHQLRLSLHDATKVYQSSMEEKALQIIPMKEDTLRSIHKTAKADSIKVFMSPKFDANHEKFVEYREELAGRIKQFYEHVRTENSNASQRQCEQCAQELYKEHIQSKLQAQPSPYSSLDQLLEDWERVHGLYLKSTQGPAQSDIFSRLLCQWMVSSTRRVWAMLQERNLSQLQELRQKLLTEEANSAERGKKLEEVERQFLAKQADLDQQLSQSRISIEKCGGGEPIGPDGLAEERNCAVCTIA